MKKYYYAILLLSIFTLHSQENIIIKYSLLSNGKDFITEKSIFLDSYIVKGDSIFGYIKQEKKFYLSKDKGVNWLENDIPNTFQNPSNFGNVKILFTGDELIFCDGSRGNTLIYSSNDFGKTWKLLSTISQFCLKEIYYENGMYFIKTRGKFQGMCLNTLGGGGLYSSIDCKNWKIISPDNTNDVSDIWFDKNEFYIQTPGGIYKSLNNGISWSNITTDLKSKLFVNINEKDSQLQVVGDYCYSMSKNKIEEFNMKTKSLKEIEIPENLKNSEIISIKSYNNTLFICFKNELYYYKEVFFPVNNAKFKNVIQNIATHSGGKGIIDDMKFNKNSIIINGNTSVPLNSILEANNTIGTNKSKVEIYRENEITQSENQTKKNQNPELPNIYNVEYFRHNGEAKLNVKSFRNCVASNNSILSLVYAPPSGNINNQQFSAIGSYYLQTDLVTNVTNDIIRDANPRYDSNKANLNTYNLNNNLDELNKIYSIAKGKQIEITEYTFGGNNAPSKNSSFLLGYEFELNSTDGSKETFELNNATIGNGICGFMAKSTFDKKTYIFIYDYKNKSKYTKIDVTKISNNLKTYSDPDNSTHINFNGDKNGIPFKTSFNNVSAIVQNEKYIYVFISGWNFSEETILPIKINKSNFSATVMTKSLLTRSNFRKQEFTDKSVSEDGYFYMPSSKGFLNYYKVLKNNNYVYKLDYYNSEFNKVWESTIDDIIINHAYESGDFIILGGYSKTSGYKGYPNPKVVVINRKTNSISYKKVIAKKNGEVSLINSDSNGNIIIAIGSYCCQAYDTDSEFVPQIIIDKLDSKGFFQNELFNK